MNFYRLSWEQLLQDTKQLTQMIGPSKLVWGIPRGGQLITALMAYYDASLCNHYEDAQVMVDDIADTGKTLAAACFTGKQLAALYIRAGISRVRVDYYVAVLNTKDYILFPYEDEQEVLKQLEKGGFRTNDAQS